jgi:DNA adenine methylase
MRYFGGKERISKELTEFINENYLKGNDKPFYDLFCGSCNVLTKINPNRELYGNDKHKYVIAMWKELQNGWTPPQSCTESQWRIVKNDLDKKPHVSGFIGFGCSFSGRWFEGYARDKSGRNFCLNAYNSTMKKLSRLQRVRFENLDYQDVSVKTGAIVYCDIPYKNTKPYNKKEVGVFDHEKFYEWCKDNKSDFTILVSEYECNVPSEGFEVVWRKESKQDIRSGDGTQKKTVEILMVAK